MVKGISKQVILVRPREDTIFEQAIFFVKDNAREVTEQQLLREAGLAAGGNVSRPRPWRKLPAFLSGAAVTALLWLLTALL